MLSLEGKAYNAKYHPVKNGLNEEKPKPKSTKKRTNEQIQWLVAHVKEPIVAGDLRAGWEKAGFRGKSLYGALGRAVQQKLIKRAADGHYRPVGA